MAQMNVLQPLINKNAKNERSAAVLQPFRGRSAADEWNERLMAILYGPIRLQGTEVVASGANERTAATY